MQNKTTTQLILSIFICSLLSCNFSESNRDSTEYDFSRKSKLERIQEALDHEFDKTYDPSLGKIPTERLMMAREYYNNIAYQSSTDYTGLIWEERGPSNVGGRTRAVAFQSATKVIAAGVSGGLWVTDDITASPPTWTAVAHDLESINFTSIAIDPTNSDILYAGTGEGLGNFDSQRGTGIYKSTDGGNTWLVLPSTQPSSSNDFNYVQKILVASDGNVYAATRSLSFCDQGGLMKSTDGGVNWDRVVGSLPSGCFQCNCREGFGGNDIEETEEGDLFYAGGAGFSPGQIYFSSQATHGSNVGDVGNWTDITPAGDWNRIEISVSEQVGSDVIYAVMQGDGSLDATGLFYSNDNGSNWTSRTIPTICDQNFNSVFTRSQAWYDLVIQIDPTDDATVFLGGIDLLKSTDSGANFNQVTDWAGNSSFFCGLSVPNVHADHHILVFNPFTANQAIVGTDGGLDLSSDMNSATPNWTTKDNGFVTSQYYSLATHPTDVNFIIGGTQDNGSHRISNAGLSNSTEVTGGDGGFTHIDANNPNNMLSAATANFIAVSTNGGSSFSFISSSTNTGRFINPSDLDDANDILFSAGNSNILEVRSDIFGSASRSTFNLALGGNQISALKVSPHDNSTLWIGDGGGNIYRIVDRTTTPTIANTINLGSGYISNIDIGSTNDIVLVTASNYGVNSVFHSTDATVGSPTFTNLDDNSTLQDIPVRWGLFSLDSDDRIVLGTELGVMYTENINGNSTAWTNLQNAGLPNVRIDMMEYDADGNLIVATHGRGMWEGVLPLPLPVQFGSFTAERMEPNVILKWQTETETNSDYFVIERSENSIDWVDIGEVNGSGTSTTTQNYSHIDSNPLHGINYYRIKQVDFDGSFEFSEIRRVDVYVNPQLVVYPNPTKGSLHLNGLSDPAIVSIIDYNGRVLKTMNAQPGSPIFITELPAGIYLVRIEKENGTTETTRIIKQ